MEPSTTAALAVRSQTSEATAGVSFAAFSGSSRGRAISRSVWLTRASESRARSGEFPSCPARVRPSVPSKTGSPVALAKSVEDDGFLFG